MSRLRRPPLLLVFATAAVVSFGAWKTLRTYEADATAPTGPPRRPLPRELLFVERNTEFYPVKLSAFLGRHELLIAFFDGRVGVDRDPLLARLRRDHAELKRRGFIVLAVGDALPDDNREAARRAGGFPFEILSDVDASREKGVVLDYDTLAAWGRFDGDTGRVRPGLVHVDRAGNVKWEDAAPVAEADPQAALDAISER